MLTGHDLHDFARELRRRRKQLRMTQRALAERMAYHPSRISQIEGGELPPEDFARQVDTLLEAGGALWALYQDIAGVREFGPPAPERELSTSTADFIAWIADHSPVEFQTVYAAVCDAVRRLEAQPPSARYGRERARRSVGRAQLAGLIAAHYGPDRLFRAKVGGKVVNTAVATSPTWITSPVELGGDDEQFRFSPGTSTPVPTLTGGVVAAAAARLASAELNGTVMINNPLYRLVGVELAAGHLAATLTTVDFAQHAMTTELMERELIDAAGATGQRLPLREAFLPDISSAFDLAGRACVGGAAAVLAIARSPEHSGRRDYVILTQERSKSVLNTTGKLAVIPKAFHQPTGEPAGEVPISITLRREFEEELLGREDLEQLGRDGPHPHVDPMHAHHLTAPMAWLLEQGGDSYRVECVGLGLNMVTSNYEFSCLIVIEDERWWNLFGHLVEVNWEAERVHRHSSLDTAGIEALIADPRWGNESLFTFLQAVRRLAQVGDPQRMALPIIDPEV